MRILIADETPDIGKRLERVLRSIPGVSTVNYCTTTDEAILALMELQPDLLLLGYRAQSTSGTEILRKIPHYSPHTEVSVYSGLLLEIDRARYHNLDIHNFYQNSLEFDKLLMNVEARATNNQTEHQYSPVPIS